MTLRYDIAITDYAGKVRVIKNIEMAGTYCVYPDGWGEVLLAPNAAELKENPPFWLWKFVIVANGQELETLFYTVIEKVQYAMTFSQKRMADSFIVSPKQ